VGAIFFLARLRPLPWRQGDCGFDDGCDPIIDALINTAFKVLRR
jgi:hypothetical protein